MTRVLIIEDEPEIRRVLGEILVGAGYEALEIANFENLDQISTEVGEFRDGSPASAFTNPAGFDFARSWSCGTKRT